MYIVGGEGEGVEIKVSYVRAGASILKNVLSFVFVIFPEIFVCKYLSHLST